MAKAYNLRDDFDDNATDTTLWVASGSAQEVNQRVEVRGSFSVPASGAYQSAATYDLTGAHVALEVVQVSSGNSATTYLEARHNNGNRVRIERQAGGLYARQWVAGQVATLASVAYDAAAHRWWRIREDGGQLSWETSPDGVDWTPLATRSPAPIPLGTVQLGFGVEIGIAPQSTAQTAAVPPEDPATAVFDNFNVLPLVVPIPDRREQAEDLRVQAAGIARNRPHPTHENNGEEQDYPYVANYSKGLRHDAVGDVVPASYHSLLHALTTRAPADFEAILLGPGGKKLTNPQAGLAFDLEGPDTHAVTQPPAPRIDSAENSSEMAELYWMALARDVHFADYDTSPVVQSAIQSLNTEFSDFRGPNRNRNGQVTTRTVFRGIYPGETTGPYVSQFLVKGTSDPRLPAEQGRSAADGFITYGALKIDQRQWTAVPGVDYLTSFPKWLEAQNGADFRGEHRIDATQRRFVRNLRDLGERVHIDNVADLFFNACLILLHEVPGDQLNGSGVVGRDMEFRYDQGNPYNPPGTVGDSLTQAGFATFGAPHVLSLVWELLSRALRAVWFQKWFVHRRLRPEEFGGRIDNHLTRRRTYPQIDGEILASLRTGLLSQHFPGAYGSYLLPQAFAEGAPTHPAYGAGHATGAGACATILKAFFDESQAIEKPVQASADGTRLVLYGSADAASMTVGGELNKLAGNVAIGRNAAGVHWRSDYTESLLLGEQVAIGVLQEQSLLFREPEFYQITRFDGTTIRIKNGAVTVV